MEDELSSSSPSTAFCTESVATFDTIWNPPNCQINLCAFSAVSQDGHRGCYFCYFLDDWEILTVPQGYVLGSREGEHLIGDIFIKVDPVKGSLGIQEAPTCDCPTCGTRRFSVVRYWPKADIRLCRVNVCFRG